MMHESTIPSPQARPEDTVRDEQDNTLDTPALEICEEAKEPSEEVLVEQAMALGEQFDYDGSVLTLEQRRALFKKCFAVHLRIWGLRSPQYYEDKSQCLSVEETTWPGVVACLKADYLKRAYFEPEDLIERLRQLKPSDNFVLRKFHHPLMKWKCPTPLQEEGFGIYLPDPDWVMDQFYAANAMERRLRDRQWGVQKRQEISDRWAALKSSVELTPLPDSHLLWDMGHSPGGTLLPWYLVKGLGALRKDAYYTAQRLHGEEELRTNDKRAAAINGWKERNPDSMLTDDPRSIYITWPADLMHELDELDRDLLRCGRRTCVTVLRETEKKMKALVTFWRDCGLITGQRTPPSPWWQDPKAQVEHLPMPQHVEERLNAIGSELGFHTDMWQKLRLIETSRWLEALINGDSEPNGSMTPLPQSLLDELDIVWRDRDQLDVDRTEDDMIASISQWKKSRHQQGLEEGLHMLPQLGSDIGPEESAQVASTPVSSGQTNLLRAGASHIDQRPTKRKYNESLDD